MEFIKRLHKEQKDLSVKIEKLRDYVENNFNFLTLSENEQELLKHQITHMIFYNEILINRLNLLNSNDEYKIYLEKLNSEELTFGQKAVGITFNPGGLKSVNQTKQLSADLIDLVETKYNELTNNSDGRLSWTTNVLRTAAFNAIITTQMAIVKFLTWKD